MKHISFFLAFIPLGTFGQFSLGTKFIRGLISYNARQDNHHGGINSTTYTYFSGGANWGFFSANLFLLGL